MYSSQFDLIPRLSRSAAGRARAWACAEVAAAYAAAMRLLSGETGLRTCHRRVPLEGPYCLIMPNRQHTAM